ncbi:MAG: glutamate 5-kinase [Gammaproteobacteria bacterium]
MNESNHNVTANRAATLSRAKRWVVKIGSALATSEGVGLNVEAIESWAAQMVTLKKQGQEIVLVTSGSVAEGAARLGWKSRPDSIHQLQAAAAVGQMGLVRAWESAYQKFGMHAAQVLLTHDDLSDRKRYLNSRTTLWTLLDLNVFPVINENDTVATEEIRFGDNDTLAGMVSNLVDADVLVILTDQQGLMSADPRHNEDAALIEVADLNDANLADIAGEGGAWGRGGMRTKVDAARLAARSATSTVVANGREQDVLLRIAAGENIGTFFPAPDNKLAARKQWLAVSLNLKGHLTLDEGACRVLKEQGRSLLPVGVSAVEGVFERGELVSCRDPGGREIARGLVNYDHIEAAQIKGLATNAIQDALGYLHEPELIHRDNLVLL